MAIFKLQAKAVVVVTTEVEASSLEDAIKKSKQREVAPIIQDSYYEKGEYWLIEPEVSAIATNIEQSE